MSRGMIRMLVSGGLLVLGIVCFALWDQYELVSGTGPYVHGISVGFLGFLFVPAGILRLAGVNLFAGGPLDKRRDPPKNEGPTVEPR